MKMEKLLNNTPPNFCLKNDSGDEICLNNHKGEWILLYFYPRDNTPGCTTEACEIRDAWNDFSKLNATVFGISADSIESHQKFKQKHDLPFSLLSDPERKVIKKYESLKPKKMFGKEYIGIMRNSVLISPDFKIVKVYEKVKPATHAREVLADIHELSKNKNKPY